VGFKDYIQTEKKVQISRRNMCYTGSKVEETLIHRVWENDPQIEDEKNEKGRQKRKTATGESEG
jgi:hypothetical protein